MMKQLNCPNCSAFDVAITGPRTLKCNYCGSVFYLPISVPAFQIDDAEKRKELCRKLCNILNVRQKQLYYQLEEQKYQQEQERRRMELVEKRAAWIRSRRCRHCGGEFAGVLWMKKCSSCGRRKDY